MEAIYKSNSIETILNHFNLVYFIFDIDSFKITYQYGNIESILGYQPVNDKIDPVNYVNESCHPDDRLWMLDRIESFLKNKIFEWSGIHRIKNKDGRWVWVNTLLRHHYFSLDNYRKKGVVSVLMIELQSNADTIAQLDIFYNQIKCQQRMGLIESLTKRELQIIKLISEGYSYTEIAAKLYIQPDTVNKHRKNIQEKLGVHCIATLMCFAKEAGLV